MSLIEHALDAAPSDAHRRLWVAARPAVRREVCGFVVGGVEPDDILVVIADHGTIVAKMIPILRPEAVDLGREPLVAVLVGEQRQVATVALNGLAAYVARVPADSITVVTVPAGATPMVAMSRVVDSRKLS